MTQASLYTCVYNANDAPSTPGVQEGIADVAAMLAEFASELEPPPAGLVARMAMASMGPNHLWEDLGLRNNGKACDEYALWFDQG
jgi:hypothetical protein